jgi:hypothetical protein
MGKVSFPSMAEAPFEDGDAPAFGVPGLMLLRWGAIFLEKWCFRDSGASRATKLFEEGIRTVEKSEFGPGVPRCYRGVQELWPGASKGVTGSGHRK